MRIVLACFLATLLGVSVVAQSPTGSIGGIVFDADARAIPGAEIIVVNDLTRVQYQTKTNDVGIYTVPNLPPGPYRVQAAKVGFKTLIKPDILLNIQDAITINFTLPVGAASIAVTVEGGAPMIDTTDATVSTVVDRQFAENLPMNGRSFQTLVMLTPGVTVVAPNAADTGQFSINGQRASSNYWMVDGVSANIGVGTGFLGNGLGGAAGAFSALGGTNSLVSIDALQEFRLQTSTYAPEFGRTPGGQISIVTRSGTNQWHGSAFDYVRNTILDANNWFADANGLAKPGEHQNDFGGTLSGPILKGKTFFFLSYEGLRLRLPEVALTHVPDLQARQNAVSAMQTYLNAFPLPNGPDDAATGVAEFNKSISNPASLDAYSLRVDHRLNDHWGLFARFNFSPSEFAGRGGGTGGDGALSDTLVSRITTGTWTAGATWAATPTVANDLRFNFSHVNAHGYYSLDNFGGAVPIASPPYPSPYNNSDANFVFLIYSLGDGEGLTVGNNVKTVQRQINVVDGLSWQKGAHSLKFGADFRRLAPQYDPFEYGQTVSFNDVPSSTTGQGAAGSLTSIDDVTLLFKNFSAYAQDTWRAIPGLTLTYGLRWDLDAAPLSLHGPAIPAVTGYSLTDLSRLAVAAPGTAPFRTTFGNLAPRLGLAYQIAHRQDRQTVVRGGFGVFYDLVSAETGTAIGQQYPPFGAYNFDLEGTFPFSPAQIAPLPILPSGSLAQFYGFNPNLRLPYTLQWSVALEQSVSKDQSISWTYIGSSGRRLLQTTSFYFLSPPTINPALGGDNFVDNTASSNYQALQVQFHRRLARGFQALASYTWAHSIDDASASSYSGSNEGVVGGYNANRGDSDFDIRDNFTAGLTYDITVTHRNRLLRAVLDNWSTESFILARSAPPVNVTDPSFFELSGGNLAVIRPDVVPGQPLYLYGGQCLEAPPLGLGQACPGGRGINPSAFVSAPAALTIRSFLSDKEI